MKSSNQSELHRTEPIAAIEQLEIRQLLSTAPMLSGVLAVGSTNHPAVRATQTVHNVDIAGAFAGTLHLNRSVPALGATHKVSVTVTVSSQSSDGQIIGSVALGQLGPFSFTGTVHRHAVALTLDSGSSASGTLTGSASASGKSLQLRVKSLVNGQSVDGTLNASMGTTKPAHTSHVSPGGGSHISLGAPMTGSGHSTGAGSSTGTSGTTTSGTGHTGTTTSGSGTVLSGPGSATSGPGSATSGPGSPTSGPGSATSGPGSPTSGPGSATSGPGSATSGPGSATGGPGSATGGPGTVNGGITLMGNFVPPAVNPAVFFGASFVQPTILPSIGSVGAVQLNVGTQIISTTMPVDGGVFATTTMM